MVKFETLGTHIMADFYGVNKKLLKNNSKLISCLKEAIILSKAELKDLNSHEFTPEGLTVTAILSESSAEMHTYPSENFISCSFYTCGNKADPMLGIKFLKDQLKPTHCNIVKIKRGEKTGMEISLIND